MEISLATRFLDVIEHEIVPLTQAGVVAGNKVFGAAVLRRSDLSVVVAATNNETANPLWHGEIHAIKLLHELPDPPAPTDCYFLATHEPCSLCLSGIAWAGFDNVAYLFSHQDSADSFAIPHDIAILRAVYAVPDPDREAADPRRDLYNRQNAFFASSPIPMDADPARVDRIKARYQEMSAVYQAGKGNADIPHA
jgi:tRNA(Arg) A34 adenosine deaminase TadA